MNLSAKIKEFDTKTPNKLLCWLQMTKFLLRFLTVFYELNKTSDEICQNSSGVYDDNAHISSYKKLNRLIIEKAIQQIELVPDQNLFTVMLLKKTQYTREFLIPKSRN